jgi:myo-inositol-1(or 4)-monophosphatase
MARRAGSLLREAFGKRQEIVFKGLIDPVTAADRSSEALLIETIRSDFPGHHVVSEERGAVQGDRRHSWYIDPLDGTVNFTHSIPFYCVSIAYAVDSVVQLGVVYDPQREELFSAGRGQGAWLNGERLEVSREADLDRSLLATGFPYDIRTNPTNNLDNYARFALRSQGVRRLGSAALDLCYVAAGRLNGYWELFIFPWDVAAGGLVAAEAGARVTDARGEERNLSKSNSILAANPRLHHAMLDVLDEDRRDGKA